MNSINRHSKLQPDEALIFLHIPEAAGSTLHRIINRQYPPSSRYHVEGGRVKQSIDELKSLPEDERAGILCLKGLMHFGLHELLPRPVHYITILRDPVERAVSHYYADETPVFEYGAVPRTALDAAKDNLKQKFIAVGLLERFDETVLLFAKALNWRNLYYQKQNITRHKLQSSEIPSKVLDTIREYNSLDIELYDFAASMFETMLSQHGIDRKKLWAFRASNRLKDTAEAAKGVVPQVIKSRLRKA